MLGKKNKNVLFHAVDESKSVVHDFVLRSTPIGFESYRAMEYRLYDKLREDEMLPRIDEHLDKLFAGEVDDGNGDMLDLIIFGAAREALPDLERQHCDHVDTLRRLAIRRKADGEDIRRIRDERCEERKAMEAEYKKICDALQNETAGRFSHEKQ